MVGELDRRLPKHFNCNAHNEKIDTHAEKLEIIERRMYMAIGVLTALNVVILYLDKILPVLGDITRK
jgi:hypothetical protein